MPKTCTIPECTSLSVARGLCWRHYRRLRSHGDPLYQRHPTETPLAFLLRSLVLDSNGCLVFTGKRDPGGYGMFGLGGASYRAHRLAYESFVGPIPAGLSICHTCDNPPCCNPDHLFPATMRQNMADKIMKGRQAMGEHCGSAKLTPKAIETIRRSQCAAHVLAKRFGVSRLAVYNARIGHTWKSISVQPIVPVKRTGITRPKPKKYALRRDVPVSWEARRRRISRRANLPGGKMISWTPIIGWGLDYADARYPEPKQPEQAAVAIGQVG